MLGQMQGRIKQKLEIAKNEALEAEEKHDELLAKVEYENNAELSKIKTLLGEQREVGSEWEKELAILKFKFSCKLDNLQHSNKELEEEIDSLQVFDICIFFPINCALQGENPAGYHGVHQLQGEMWSLLRSI